MKRTFAILLLFLFTTSTYIYSQNLKDLSFGTDSTFEVLTWNIEWFPKNGQVTVDSVKQIIESLDVDLLGLQEIDDTVTCRQMINSLEGYELFMDDDWFGGLAYVYKTSSVEVQSIYKIYDTSPFWSAFPRSPLVIELRFMNKDIIVINNHFKCCGDGILTLSDPGDEETRRFEANNLLKQYIDTHWPNERVIVLGDLNDNLTDNSANNVFQAFLNDTNNYAFADMDIALGSSVDWSFPGWPSHLDHILITNELFNSFGNGHAVIQTLKIDNYLSGGFAEYDNKISDHRPVALKIQPPSNPTNLEDLYAESSMLRVSPNPSNGIFNFYFESNKKAGTIRIYNMRGQKIEAFTTSVGQSSFHWNAEGIEEGVYYAQYFIANRMAAYKKLVVMK